MSPSASETWQEITPGVDSTAEFKEIINDFGHPLELVREGISNAIDWNASEMHIEFVVEVIDGTRRLVIRMNDNGTGMPKKTLSKSFWGLGFSESRELQQQDKNADFIGNKGHGTKVYLRSESVRVSTQHESGAFESLCENPLRCLNTGGLHKPKIRDIDKFLDDGKTGTHIEIIGYNDNERSQFVQGIVKDYILWFTKVGSVEQEFGVVRNNDFRLFLKSIDSLDYEEIIKPAIITRHSHIERDRIGYGRN